jgi:inositol oxygenase
MHDERYNTELGVYEEGCGLDNLHLAWGHDEYLFQVLQNHKDNTIPEAGMVMVRYHSFYPWHTGGSYTKLLSEKDEQYKEWIKDFNQYDLYTKCPKIYNLDEMKEYYLPIAEKYLGSGNIFLKLIAFSVFTTNTQFAILSKTTKSQTMYIVWLFI